MVVLYLFLIPIVTETVCALKEHHFKHAVFKTPQELVEEKGYPFESHFITTSDGYILNLHRIPSGKNGTRNNKVAFLLHGITFSSTDFMLFPDSLGYFLADEGYDVWMGNARGNTYSRNHTTLNPDKDAKFWQFSWNEMGVTDLPAMIDYVMEKTKVDGLYYIGHSQGVTTFFVMASEKPEYNNKIKAHVAMAPVGYINHMTNYFLRIMSQSTGFESFLSKLFGVNELFSSTGIISRVSHYICTENPFICEDVIFFIYGFSANQTNVSRMLQIIPHVPAGTSTKQLLHFAQCVKSGHFRKYDYGPIQNIVKYKTINPPDYDLSKINTSIYLFYSGNDVLVSTEDVKRLYNNLPNAIVMETGLIFNHLDFLYGFDAPELVYKQIVKAFRKH